MVLKIELFNSKIHSRTDFDCGIQSLNHYLIKTASQDQRRKVTTVFVLVDKPENRVIAYYTLSAFTIEVEELNASVAKKLPRYPRLPATMLGRLAVDLTYHKQHLGRLMLVNALKRAYKNTEQIASIAVVVDAIDENAVRFYRKYGFTSFASQSSRLYLSMKAISLL
ncbi:MAG: GNAT family N-acetyltransferase [Pleurocapsa sp. MO_226.B13]|nr:GNAT family N-acetyltransferase [Pleurocapsa sp. MO_226.B13]